MERLARFLFGHEPAVFANGKFGFDARPQAAILILLALLLTVFIYFVYIRPRLRLSKPIKATLVLLRTALIALIVFLLLRPIVVVSSVIPRSSYVAVLVDDSLSMRLKDMPGGATRLESVKQALLAEQNSFMTRLEEKFKTDLYGFSEELFGLKRGQDLYGEGRSSDLGGGIDEVVKRSAGIPLSAVVVATDGAANVPRDLGAILRELRARDVPVYTIGVGSTSRAMDAELARLNVPRRVLVGSRVNLEVLVSLNGYGAKKALIAVREDGRATKTEEFNLRGNETQTINMEFVASTPGWHRYSVEITPLDGELTIENNKQESLVEVIEGPLRVLYVEGEPRWELGKIRESLQPSEKNVILVSLQRTGENKFYRQGIGSQQELVSGFPKTEDELFAYQGLILGSVEASFFTVEQMRNIESFVSRRGGGLLAIGGRLAFDGGKYRGTPVADALPVVLEGRTTDVAESFAPVFKPQLTRSGQAHPITRLNEDRAISLKTWTELPPISVSESLNSVKPGATVLLEAHRVGSNAASSGQTAPLLVQQRYGRGQSLAFTAADTWRWRMKMDSKSNAHETFWRQMLRYLVSNSPMQTEIAAEHDVFAVNDTVRIIADLRDKQYNPVSDVGASARVIKPSGATIEVPLKFTALNDLKNYTGEFKADELGQHRIELVSNSSNIGSAKAQSSILVSELNREFYSAAQNSELLKRIAAETGGKYYQLDELESLVDDLTYRRTPYSERATKELWDMPINFILIIGLVSAEWFLRKREGLA
jgi:uncharacterized membrane protein